MFILSLFMAIPEAQLETWSNLGPVAGSTAAYNSIRAALYAPSSQIRNMDIELYLQGSYRNGTNVRADSDVDIVAQLNATFTHNALTLPALQYQAFRTQFPGAATYRWEHFRRDVLASLRAYYGNASVTEGSRCFKVVTGVGRPTADVLPALQYRYYSSFFGANSQPQIEGIWFQDRTGRVILNYPKLHYENGVWKNSEQCTNGWFKPTVRVFKNARSCAVDRGYLDEDAAPSYFVDCLIWNVSNNQFGPTYEDTYCNLVNYLNVSDFNGFMCRNGVLPLFGDSQEQWTHGAARALIAALILLWNERR